MDVRERKFGVHWETEAPFALWQLTGENWLRVDVTEQFDARYRVVAYKPLTDEEAERIRRGCQYRDPKLNCARIQAEGCGQNGWMGYQEDVFDLVGRPGEGFNWRVTNHAGLVPGLRRWKDKHFPATNFSDWVTKNPDIAYQVQFNSVPWGVFTRYWRKPINLNRQFHTSTSRLYGKGSYTSGVAALNVLDFDMGLIRDHHCFFADFSHMNVNKTRTADVRIAMWMMKYARAFRVLSDCETPFARLEDETLFTIEWL